MQTVLDIVGDVGIGKFGQRPFDGDMTFKSPRLQAVECNDLDERAKCAPRRFFHVLRIVKDFPCQHILKTIHGWICHYSLRPHLESWP